MSLVSYITAQDTYLQVSLKSVMTMEDFSAFVTLLLEDHDL